MNLKEYIVGKTVLFHKACCKSQQKSKERVQMSLVYIYILDDKGIDLGIIY